MEPDELYKLIGNITYSFTLIDFLISYFAVDLEIVESPYEFFAINSFESKIKKLKNKAALINDNEMKLKFIKWIENLDKLRKKRNSVIHSIILKNTQDSDEYRLFNYKKNGMEIFREIKKYETVDFTRLNQELINAHNNGHYFLNKLK